MQKNRRPRLQLLLLLATGRRNRRPRLPLLLEPGLLQMPEPAKGRAEQQFTQARVQNCLYLVYIYVDYFDRYKRLYLFIYVHIIQEIQTDMNVYIRLYISCRYKRDMCMSISCVYNRSDMHRYKRLYLFIYVHIIMQICTDINVYIRLYFSGRYKQDMCILFI